MKATTLIMAPMVLLAACASVPSGPSVMALPGANKSFEQFRADDADCRQYAQTQTGDSNQAALDAGLKSAAVGTVVGAIAGAAIGGNHQSTGSGAGAGLLVGSMAGSGAAQNSGRATQQRYDHAYVQCMYAKGEQVPVAGNPAPARRWVAPEYYPAPQPGYISAPPPPPSSLPPPPAR